MFFDHYIKHELSEEEFDDLPLEEPVQPDPLPRVIDFPDRKQVSFLEGTKAVEVLLDDSHDPFFSHLTVDEIRLRLSKRYCKLVSETTGAIPAQIAFRSFATRQIRRWQEREFRLLSTVLQNVWTFCNFLPELFPDHLRLVKISEYLEGSALFTRRNCIFIPCFQLDHYICVQQTDEYGNDNADFVELLIHELFHCFSRYHPEFRHRLYKCIGFEELPNLSLGTWLQSRRVLNPDAPGGFYFIVIREENRSFRAVLVDYWRKNSPPSSWRGFLPQCASALVEIEEGASGEWNVRHNAYGRPTWMREPKNNVSFMEQTGGNTFYLNHPEEICADNMALLAMSRAGYDTDEVGRSGADVLEKIADCCGTEFAFQRGTRPQGMIVGERQRRRLASRSIEGARSRTRTLENNLNFMLSKRQRTDKRTSNV